MSRWVVLGVDKARTGPLTDDGIGIAVGLLHTGTTYSDDISALLRLQTTKDRPPYPKPQGNNQSHDRRTGDGDGPAYNIGRHGQWQRTEKMNRGSDLQYAQHPAP